MTRKTFLLGALAYLLVTFPLAFVWHLVIFKDVYQYGSACIGRTRAFHSAFSSS